MKINLCHCQFILMSSNIHFFIGIPSHWLFVSCSRLSPSTGLCRTQHPPTVADHHDTPAVTGGLHPLLDIAPKNHALSMGSSYFVHLYLPRFAYYQIWSVCIAIFSWDRRGSQIHNVGHMTMTITPQGAVYLSLHSTCHSLLIYMYQIWSV